MEDYSEPRTSVMLDDGNPSNDSAKTSVVKWQADYLAFQLDGFVPFLLLLFTPEVTLNKIRNVAGGAPNPDSFVILVLLTTAFHRMSQANITVRHENT